MEQTIVTGFKIEEVEFELESRRISPYAEIYNSVRSLAVGKKLRIGPFSRKEANSVQTSITQNCKAAEWAVKTFIRNFDATPAVKDQTELYLFIVKEAATSAV